MHDLKPMLEYVLMYVAGNNNQIFLEKPKKKNDGSTEYFTTEGAQAYDKLTNIIYTSAKITGHDKEGKKIINTLSRIIWELDNDKNNKIKK